jgi:hypothetical protein
MAVLIQYDHRPLGTLSSQQNRFIITQKQLGNSSIVTMSLTEQNARLVFAPVKAFKKQNYGVFVCSELGKIGHE